MIKKSATLLLSAALLYSSASYADKVIATYKGGEVTETEVLSQFKDALQAQPNLKDKKFADLEKGMQEALINGYINAKLLEQEATNSNVEKSKDFQDKLENVKKQLLQQAVVEKYLKSAVSDKMVDEEYKKVSDNLKNKNEIKVSHILVDTEEKAKEAKKKLNKGSKFADVAKEYSTDQSDKSIRWNIRIRHGRSISTRI
jgi:hypothetical protein